MSNIRLYELAIDKAIKELSFDPAVSSATRAGKVGKAVGILKSARMAAKCGEYVSPPAGVSLDEFARLVAEEVRQKFAELSRAKEVVSETEKNK